ncbi:MAG TPA: hypothetical protein DD723_03520 [Candidatus Omnitrophica bacterium]|nr:MAG: hypothetical protein A2Z81_00755 [Omnitrophica WOR_2 bacterium GWA2_45_18]OGX19712.1 MAG: hypothetical protein A2Y04_01685 [Omnitrophica WOR_2 bacterium GWC2_45_7]HBR14600.1 hypothetical protein [Candidatus Omnitrophota bacterium]
MDIYFKPLYFRKAFVSFRVAVFLGIVFQVSLLSVFAQESGSMSAGDVFEFSLRNLKDSAKQVVQKNEELLTRNRLLRQKIDETRHQVNSFDQQRAGLIDDSAKSDYQLKDKAKEAALVQKGMARLKENMVQLQEEQDELRLKMAAKKKMEKEYQSQIGDVQREINQLKNKLGSADESSPKQAFVQEKEELLKSIKENESNFGVLESKMRRIQKNHNLSVKTVDELKVKQNLARQEIMDLQNEYKILLEQENLYFQEVQQLEQRNNNQSVQMDESMKELKSRCAELEKTLSKAGPKAKQYKLDRVIDEGEEGQLRDNLSVMKKENINLNEEIASLANKLKGAQ